MPPAAVSRAHSTTVRSLPGRPNSDSKVAVFARAHHATYHNLLSSYLLDTTLDFLSRMMNVMAGRRRSRTQNISGTKRMAFIHDLFWWDRFLLKLKCPEHGPETSGP